MVLEKDGIDLPSGSQPGGSFAHHPLKCLETFWLSQLGEGVLLIHSE